MAGKKAIERKRRGRAAIGEGRPKTVYLSAPAGMDTRAIRQTLQDKGLRSFSPDELDLPGQNLSDVLRGAMSRADLVLAVVDSTSASNFVFFEVGYARAAGKPTFVLLTGDAPASLWVSSGVPYFKFNPDHPTGLDFAVGQILAVPHHRVQHPPAPGPQTRPLGDRASELLVHLRHQGEAINEVNLAGIIGQAVRESAVTSVSSGGKDGQYVDFSVWSDDFSPWVGNPIAIEVKCRLRSGPELNAAVGQLLQAMSRSGIPFGLLIYVRSPLDVAGAIAVPNIAAIAAESFLEDLRTTSLGELVRRLRHQRVHGGS